MRKFKFPMYYAVFLWIFLIVIIFGILGATFINQLQIKRRLILCEMEFIAQITFETYKRLGYENIISVKSKKLEQLKTSENKSIYPDYSRTVTIYKLSDKDAYQIDLNIARDRYRKNFSYTVSKHEE